MSASSTSAAALAPLAGDLPTLQFPVIVGDQEVFDPDPFDVAPGEEVLLKFLGSGSAEVNVFEYDTDTPYALFKGTTSTNPYPVSSDGTAYTVRDDAPEDTSYTIVYQAGSAIAAADTTDSISVAAVRGTINVRKPTR